MKDPAQPILLVEDDRVDALCVRRALKELKVPNPLVHMGSAEDALRWLAGAESPCLILLDINMPRMSGIEFLRELREVRRYCGIPVVVLTTSREPSDRCETFRLGVAGYMVKPVDYSHFVRIMNAVCEYWRLSETPAGCPN